MSFASFVREADDLVVQPRMGFADPAQMRAGLGAVRSARAVTVGTLTLDSYTRVGDLASAYRATAGGERLNGYPLLTHPRAITAGVLDGIADPAAFPVQVRHGSALPLAITRGVLAAGLDATEGGPVSYCLPYSRVPLAVALDEWTRAVELFAATDGTHLESFGGCLLGQLCPPSLLVAVSLLEALFFARHGMRSVSLSYAQQTDPQQDAEALAALNRLAREWLDDWHDDPVDWHVVVYTYMGVYPSTDGGARDLLAAAARLARDGGAKRLIVKTSAESRRIPTVAENVEALELAARAAAGPARPTSARAARRFAGVGPRRRVRADAADSAGSADNEVYDEASRLVQAVLELDADPGRAMVRAFAAGLLDLPFSLHPDNTGAARSTVDPATGRLHWTRLGRLPLRPSTVYDTELTSASLLRGLRHVADRHDAPYLQASGR